MFESKQIPYYIFGAGIVFMIGSLTNRAKSSLDTNNDDEMIKNYLLNESPLYGYNRPKIWIHSKYELNARKWKDFYSRNTTNLNQDYIHLTIKTIINHCGNDFNICLIDDDSFSKLLPNWDIDLVNIAEPHKSNYRTMGLVQLVHLYGGMVVPNSFLCLKNLKTFYDEHTEKNQAFVCETINRTSNIVKGTNSGHFISGLEIFGANKSNNTMFGLIEFMKEMNRNGHFHEENKFLGSLQHECNEKNKDGHLTIVGGDYIGIKTTNRKPILIDDLFEESYIDLPTYAYGIHIPADDVLKRKNFQWFASMHPKEIMKTNIIISKYLKASITDTSNEYYKQTQHRSVVSI
jgi:hypothetical protein